MNTAPFFWLIAAVGFLVLEGCTFNMTSIWFAIGAAAALISCLFTDLFRVQALLFIVVSVLCLLAFRPLAAKLRKNPTATNGDRNLGREATVPCSWWSPFSPKAARPDHPINKGDALWFCFL